jgi:hypothetical protein
VIRAGSGSAKSNALDVVARPELVPPVDLLRVLPRGFAEVAVDDERARGAPDVDRGVDLLCA